MAVLAEVGWADFSIERVAAASGVHKTTIYRRWPTRESLISEAAMAHAQQAVPIPDTGSLYTDLSAIAHELVAEFNSPAGRALLRVAVDGSANTALHDVRNAFFTARYALLEPLVTRAVARGEAPAGTVATAVARTLSAQFLVRLLITGEPLDPDAAAEAAAVTTAATAAGALATQPPLT
ncbi:TetR-like C-terminal domain-containing protein [Dactylosporangium sp. NPDC005572]|uniref:TetR-like C-terminal domain-containing protein n=1 Tax=Dactylosporangium sp. NPDC005572 TaxID=3156889 RepID=UPI0033AFC5F0